MDQESGAVPHDQQPGSGYVIPPPPPELEGSAGPSPPVPQHNPPPAPEHVKPLRKQNSTIGEEISTLLFGSEQQQPPPIPEAGHSSPPRNTTPPQAPQPADNGVHPRPHSQENFLEVHLGNVTGKDMYEDAEDARQSSDGGGMLELVHWLPTLPQLFILLAVTQMLLTFFLFIAMCSEVTGVAFLGAAEDWYQIMSWIVFLLMNIVCLLYMRYVKGRVAQAATSTLMFFFVFLSLFYAPLTSSSYTRAFQATFTFFRVIFIFLITAVYAIAYREDIVPPREHLPPTLRNFVVSHRLDQA